MSVSGRELRRQAAKFLILSVLLMIGCDFSLLGSCEDTILSDVASPGGRYVATVFERGCGATTDFSTLVSLRASGEKFDLDDQGWILSISGRHPVTLAWSADNELVVHYPRAETFTKELTWKDVVIVYQ
jgi:hypothetical protein